MVLWGSADRRGAGVTLAAIILGSLFLVPSGPAAAQTVREVFEKVAPSVVVIRARGRDVDASVPPDAGEIRFPGTSLVPRRRYRGHRRRALADEQRRLSWPARDSRFDHFDRWRSGIEQAQQLREVRLRLNGHDATPHCCKGARAVACVRAEVEDQVAVRHELGVQMPQTPLAQRYRVVDGE